jgi:HPt (histidine-containing phosphotransfer) domain-containing protein
MNPEVPYPVDEKVLSKTIGNDKNRVREMLGYFAEPSRKIVTEMHHAFVAHSAVGIKNAAHKLKSSARTIGANALADICVLLEDAGKKDDWNVIANNYPLIENLFADVEVFIKNY